MKRNFYLLSTAIAAMLLIACNDTREASNYGDFLAVKVSGEKNWSIIDVNTGKFLYRDEFKNKPKIINEDRFFVEKDRGKGYECYDVNNISSAINKEAYYSATYFEDGLSPVVYMDTTIMVIDRNCDEKAVLGHNIISAQPFKKGYSIVYNDEFEAGMVSATGQFVIRPQFDVIMPISDDGYAVTCKQMNDSIYSYAIIDTVGTKYYSFTSEKYDPITGLENGSMAVRKDHKVVYIDREGNRLLDAGEYIRGTSMCYGIYDHMTVYATEGGKMGVMDDKGDKLIRDKYDLVIPTKDGMFVAYNDDKCGLIDKDDNKVLPFDFESITKVKDDRYVVKEGDYKYYIIDDKGNEISKETLSAVAVNDNSLKSFLSNLTLVKKPGQQGSAALTMESLRKFVNSYTTTQDDISRQVGEWERDFREEYESMVQDAYDATMEASKALENFESGAVSQQGGLDNMHEFVEGMIPDLQSRRLTNDDIMVLDKSTLRLLRNAIYARHGYVFESQDLAQFFSKYSWYMPSSDDVSASLSSIEKQNVDFIKSHE